MYTKRVPISSINSKHGLWHLRVLMDGSIGLLAHAMGVTGQREPILVRPVPGIGYAYQLITGSRRLAAASALGWDEVLVASLTISDPEAATLALADELAERVHQTCLERAWSASRAKKLRGEAGMATGIRPMAAACGVTRSTMANVIRVGETFPEAMVESVAQDLGVSIHDLLPIPQSPLLEISKAQESHVELLRVAAQAFLSGARPRAAVRDAMAAARASEEDDEPTLYVGRHVRVQADGPAHIACTAVAGRLATGDAQGLAVELREAAAALERMRPTGVHGVQVLDTKARFTDKGWVARLMRTAAEFGVRAWEALTAWLGRN